MNIKTRLLTCVVAALLLGGMAPAQADRPLVHEHYSDSIANSFDDCGFTIAYSLTARGHLLLKAPRIKGAPALVHDNYRLHETFNAFGRTLTVDHRGLFRFHKVTHVRGDIYRIVARESGQPFVVRDGEGDVLIRDRGLLVTAFLLDTQGDRNPDNDQFVEGSLEVLADHGHHPGFYIDFCAFMRNYFLG